MICYLDYDGKFHYIQNGIYNVVDDGKTFVRIIQNSTPLETIGVWPALYGFNKVKVLIPRETFKTLGYGGFDQETQLRMLEGAYNEQQQR